MRKLGLLEWVAACHLRVVVQHFGIWLVEPHLEALWQTMRKITTILVYVDSLPHSVCPAVFA